MTIGNVNGSGVTSIFDPRALSPLQPANQRSNDTSLTTTEIAAIAAGSTFAVVACTLYCVHPYLKPAARRVATKIRECFGYPAADTNVGTTPGVSIEMREQHYGQLPPPYSALVAPTQTPSSPPPPSYRDAMHQLNPYAANAAPGTIHMPPQP